MPVIEQDKKMWPSQVAAFLSTMHSPPPVSLSPTKLLWSPSPILAPTKKRKSSDLTTPEQLFKSRKKREDVEGVIRGLPNLGRTCSLNAACLILHSFLRFDDAETTAKYVGGSKVVIKLLQYIASGEEFIYYSYSCFDSCFDLYR
jgi:hypothetical protein